MAEPAPPPWEGRPPCFNHGKFEHCGHKAALLFSDGTFYEFDPVFLHQWVMLAYNTRRGTQFNYGWRDSIAFKKLNGWPDWGEATTDKFHQNDNLNPYNWDWTDLEEWIAAHPGSEKEAFQEWLLKHKNDQTDTVQTPQMDQPEALHEVPMGDPDGDNVPLYYPDGQENKAVNALENLWELKNELPPAIFEKLKKFVITSQKSNPSTQDAGDPEGSVTVYGNGSVGKSNVLHEMGHNFALERWGSTTPPQDSDYRAAINSNEDPITAEAGSSPANDFAEAFAVYCLNPERLHLECPRRYAIIHRMVNDPDYPG